MNNVIALQNEKDKLIEDFFKLKLEADDVRIQKEAKYRKYMKLQNKFKSLLQRASEKETRILQIRRIFNGEDLK